MGKVVNIERAWALDRCLRREETGPEAGELGRPVHAGGQGVRRPDRCAPPVLPSLMPEASVPALLQLLPGTSARRPPCAHLLALVVSLQPPARGSVCWGTADRGEPAAAARRGRSWRRRRGAERPWHGASPARPGAQPRGPRALSGRGSCAGGSGPGAAARPMERPRAGPPAGGRAAGGRWALRRRLR